jgi:branched-chain amino acid transport system permease protein
MVDVGSTVVFAVLLGSLYALVALGFTLILSLRGVVNLAYGAYLMFAAYTYLALTNAGLAALQAVAVAVLGTAVISLVLYLVLVRYIEHDEEQTFLTTFLLAFVLQELYIYYYGSPNQLLDSPIAGNTRIGSIVVSNTQVAGVVAALVVIALFILFVRYTTTGQAIIAISLDEVGADLVGINTQRVNYVTWLISGGMAGLAGIFLGTQFSASPEMWLNPLLIAFAVVIVGGIGSIKGAIIAAFLIGFVETLTVSIGSPSWRGVFTYAILIAIIMVRPTGLFGREVMDSE